MCLNLLRCATWLPSNSNKEERIFSSWENDLEPSVKNSSAFWSSEDAISGETDSSTYRGVTTPPTDFLNTMQSAIATLMRFAPQVNRRSEELSICFHCEDVFIRFETVSWSACDCSIPRLLFVVCCRSWNLSAAESRGEEEKPPLSSSGGLTWLPVFLPAAAAEALAARSLARSLLTQSKVWRWRLWCVKCWQARYVSIIIPVLKARRRWNTEGRERI